MVHASSAPAEHPRPHGGPDCAGPSGPVGRALCQLHRPVHREGYSCSGHQCRQRGFHRDGNVARGNGQRSGWRRRERTCRCAGRPGRLALLLQLTGEQVSPVLSAFLFPRSPMCLRPASSSLTSSAWWRRQASPWCFDKPCAATGTALSTSTSALTQVRACHFLPACSPHRHVQG